MTNAIGTRFEDRAVLVTGSNYGIGRATAERFAREGASVVVTGRDEGRCRETVAGIEDAGGEATAVTADLANPAEIEALIEAAVEACGKIDVLVNNAAAQTQQTVIDTTLDEWAFTFDVNLRAYWLTVKHALAHVPDGGAIVNVSSNHAFETGPGVFPYNVTKTAIDGLTRAMALEFGPAIRVNTVNSGWVPTGEDREAYEAGERFAGVDDLHPVGRMGRPADLAGAIAFLASDDAAFVTGANLPVDGGRSAVMYDRWLPAYGDRTGPVRSWSEE
ncbi:MAG: SDR family NAD(P)-dependent oxidoreductase [Halobacteriales archaeon]